MIADCDDPTFETKLKDSIEIAVPKPSFEKNPALLKLHQEQAEQLY